MSPSPSTLPDAQPAPTAAARTRSPAGPDLTPYAVGALLGGALWTGLVLLGATKAAGIPGTNVVPFAALAGAVTVWAARRRPRLRTFRRGPWALLAIEAALLLVVAYTPLTRWLVPPLVRRDTIARAPVDGVVVLSSWITHDGYLQQDAVDRLLSGLAVVRATGARNLLLSRTERRRGAEQLTSDADQRRIVALLGPRTPRILLVTEVHATRDEAVRMRALTRPLGIDRVAVVTSPMHTRRACATFEKVGFSVTCVPSESRDVAFRTLRSSADRVRAFQLWLYEWAAFAVYRTRGWI